VIHTSAGRQMLLQLHIPICSWFLCRSCAFTVADVRFCTAAAGVQGCLASRPSRHLSRQQ
jgi:hypothetical protein